ncbi:MAG: MipA/OmpV family protein [bacterium]|nr:MipA/OmpV family protein [bacterium]
MRRSRSFAALLVVAGVGLAFGAAPAAAQGRPEPEGVQWSLGLGVISSPRPYVGADNRISVIPLLDLEYKRFYFRGILAGFQLIESEHFSLDIIGRGQFAGYEEDDSSFLAGMEERRETIEVGLSAAWELGALELEATVAADTLGRSEGAQASLELTWSKEFGRGKGGLFPGVGVIWQDADFIDYYAGVEPEEARPGRPAFESSSALNLGAGLLGFFKVTDRIRFVGLARVERLSSEYEESPIIDSRWGYFGLVALTYEF